jgi:hypothetical protein
MGNYSGATGSYCTAIGNRAYAGGDIQFAIGVSGTAPIAIGASGANNNALVILKNGIVGIGTNTIPATAGWNIVNISITPPSTGIDYWNYITSSSDGTKLAAVGNSIHYSVDSGLTWKMSPDVLNKTFYGITSSSDGTKLAAVERTTGYIWTSTDLGATWTQRQYMPNLSGITSSSDGTKLAVTVYNGKIWRSIDSGVNWLHDSVPYASPVKTWGAICCSFDGKKLAAVVDGGGIWTSNDYAVTWGLNFSTTKDWRDICCSFDGSKIYAVAYGGYIYTSSDSGGNWTYDPFGPTQNWRGICCSGDGTRLAATVENGNIWTSINSGSTWIQTTTTTTPSGPSTQSWWGITSNYNGTKLTAVVYGGNIWQLTTGWGPTTILDISGSLQVQGDITATGDIISNFTSDIRFKTNIKKIKNPLEKLSRINGYTYNWIESDLHPYHGEDTGVIAQEVETINLPGVAVTRESGYKGVKYERLIPLLLESIKSLQETNLKQQKQINQLMKK